MTSNSAHRKSIAYVIGAGGHARSLIDLVCQDLGFEIKEIIDLTFHGQTERISNIPVVGDIDRINKEGTKKDVEAFLAIGDNQERERLAILPLLNEVSFPSVIGSTAYNSGTSKIGKGVQVFQQAYIGSSTDIGDFCIVNTASVIEHEAQIGSFSHIAVGAVVAGRVSIGKGCTIGANATVIDGINICDNVLVGSGAVVTSNITEENSVWVGVPAKRIK